VDELRQNPEATLRQWFAASDRSGRSRLPRPIAILLWRFVTGSRRDFFRDAALRALRVR